MDYLKLKSMLEEQQESEPKSATETPVAPQADQIPPTMDPVIAQQMIQEMKLRDIERAKQAPFEALRQKLAQEQGPYQAPQIPGGSYADSELGQQLLRERLAEQEALNPGSTGKNIDQISQEKAAEEVAKMTELQKRIKGGTPGLVDLANQK